MNKRTIFVSLCAMFVIIAILSVWLFIKMPTFHNEKQISIITGLIESNIQFLFLGILGLVAKWLIDETQRITDERRALRNHQDERYERISGELRDLLRQIRAAHQIVRVMPLDVEVSKSLSTYLVGARALVDARQKYIEIGDQLRNTELRKFVDKNAHSHVSKIINYLSDILFETYNSTPESWEDITSLR